MFVADAYSENLEVELGLNFGWDSNTGVKDFVVVVGIVSVS